MTTVGLGSARYRRHSWPRDGGAGEQDAWLTQALEYLETVYNAILREDIKRTTKATETD